MANRVVSVSLVADVGRYVSGMTQAATATKGVGETATQTQAKATRGFDLAGKGALLLGGAVVAGLGAAVSKSMDFERSMSAIQAATQASAATLGDLRDAAMKAGADTQYSATEAADAITEMAKAGVSAADIMGGGLDGALSLAAAGQLDVADAAGIASVAMTQFKLSGQQLPHVADLLAAGAGKAMGSVEDLGMALNQAGLVASSTGISIEETTGTLAAFASAGLIGSDAGTSMKTALQKLSAPSKEASELMSELGIAAYDANGNFVGLASLAGQLQTKMGGLTQAQRDSAMATIFGSDAVRAANVLYSEGADGINEWTAKVNDAGYAQRQAAQLTDNLAGDLERLGGSFDTLLITLGGAGQGPLRLLVQALGGIVDGVTWTVEAFQSVPGPVLAAVGALVAVHTLSGPMQTAVKGVGFAIDVMAASFRNAGGPMGTLRAGAGGLLGILGGPWGLAITGATIGLTSLWSWLHKSADATDEAKSAAQTYAAALAESSGAIDDNVRLSAAKAAEDAGLLSTADRMGIALGDVTDAITGQGNALDTVRDRIKRYIDDNMVVMQTENGPVTHMNAQVESAQRLLAGLDLLAGQGPKTAEGQARVAEAAGTTGAALEASKAQTDAATKALEEWQKKVQTIGDSFIEPLSVYKGMLDEKTAKERESAEKTAAATESGKDSWKDYVKDVSVSLDEYATKLQEQLTNQENWRINLGIIAQRAGVDVANQLMLMGADGVQLVAQMANGTDAEMQRMAALILQEAKGATAGLDGELKVMAAIGAAGAGATARGIADQLNIGVGDVVAIARKYAGVLGDAINPILTSLGKPPVLIGGGGGRLPGQVVANADGNLYEQHQAEIAPAGAWRVWAEPETGGEAYIPLAPSKRPRSLSLWRETGRLLGVDVENYAYGGVQPHVAASGNMVTAKFGPMPGGIGGVGARSGPSDHPLGLALDYMVLTNRALGDQVAGYLQSNAAQHMIKYLIWKQAINQGRGWTKMEDRGSITANHFDHVHASYLRAGEAGSGFSGAGGSLMPELPPIPNFPFNGIGQSANRWAEAAREQTQSFLDGIFNGSPVSGPGAPGESGGGPPGSGVERWRGLVMQALALKGQPGSLADTTLRRMQKESGGDPRAINNWDSNAAKGTPSKGLMQVIDPTFRAYAMAGYNRDIWDPMSNVLASMGYALARYGSLPAAYNRPGGYDEGGIAEGVGYMAKATIRPERVLSPRQTEAFEQWMSREVSGPALGRGGSAPITVNITGATVEGRFEIGGDGLGRIVDGRVVSAITTIIDRGANNG